MGEFPVENFLQDKCPEYLDKMLTIKIEAAGVEWSMTVEGEGEMTGTYTGELHWSIGEETWIETQGPTPFRASPLEPSN